MSDDELSAKISARVMELRAELDKFIRDAEKQIAAYQTAIGELEKLIDGH